MNTGDLISVLKTVFSEPERRVVLHLTGPPGCGKTSIPTAVAEELGLPVMTLALPTCEAVDLRGLPQVIGGQTVWASPLPRTGRGLLLLDEISSAPPDVQVAAHHLIWNERGSDMSLPSTYHIVLTGNRASDKTLFRPMSAPLRNRLTVLSVEPDLTSWTSWAYTQGVHPSIIGFLRWRPEMLIAKDIPGEGGFPSPRAWMQISRIVGLSISAGAEREMLTGTIGEGAAIEYGAYLRTARELPSIQEMIDKPQKASVSKSPSVSYAVVSALAMYTRREGVSAMPYVKRLPAEYAVMYLRDIRDRYDIRKDLDIREWVAKHSDLFDW